jgi:N-methylhydantoinase A
MVVRYHYALHKMEVVSIGLAGGSVISLEPRTRLPKVGPRSAGAYPGPVCYGFGGAEPTITDVDLLLGYLDPRFFLGGRAQLDVERAWQACQAQVADPLGMEVLEAAAAIYRLANSMIYDLLHKQTVEKGLDPRQYALFVYGGTAGMHMSSIGHQLGVRQIVIPHSASVHGAFGLVSAEVVYTDATARVLRVPASPDEINSIFAVLSERVTRRLMAAGFRQDEVRLQRAVDMRYRRQIHVINTPVEGSERLTGADLEQLAARFEVLYAERYGRDAGYREAGIEMVSFLLRGSARLQEPRLAALELGPPSPETAYVETRKAYFDSVRRIEDAHCYDFVRLLPGNEVDGPAIIWTPITTVVVNPGQTATCDGYKNLVITW